MPIQISDLFALTSRQKNALRLKIVHLKCDEHFSHFWPIRFSRIPKWNFRRILVAHPIHLTLRGPMMTHQASQELIKSFGDKDSFMNGHLGCLLLGQVEVIPDHPPDQSWNVLDHVTVIGFVFFPKISKRMLFLCGLGGFHISSVAWIWPSRSIWAADWSLLPSKRAAVGRWIACGLRRPSPRLQPIWVCSFRGAMADVIIRYVVSAHVFGQGWLRMTWASSIVNGGTSCYLSGWAHDLSCTQFVTMVGLGSVMVGPYLSGRIQSHVYLEDLKTLDVSKCHAVFLKWWSTEVLRQGLQGLIDGSTKVAGLWFNVTVDTSMIV